MELCIIIPAKNEELSLRETIENIQNKLKDELPFNILVVNDHSDDGTLLLLEKLASSFPNLKYVSNEWEGGVGNAIRYGMSMWHGDILALCMADGSDAPQDILLSYKKIQKEGFDCVFGSRFIKGGRVKNYPIIKLSLNRIFNTWVRIVSGNKYNDFTNIFKVYNRRAIEAIMPLDSTDFSIGLEMSLKAYKKKLSIAVIPISWTQRKAGTSKLKLSKNFQLYMSTLQKSLKKVSAL
ncbi:MAG: glycosyltransferase family 2 protein [Chitinophagales bacterium]|nr:glycosyltransferase family 2 protein [Chitinophagales bacterium]